MNLDTFSHSFEVLDLPRINDAIPPSRATVASIRDLLASAVRNDRFVLQCLALELDRIENANARFIGLVPFCTLPLAGVSMAFGHWPPGNGPGVHEHLDWTITAVCRNQVRVETYDYEQAYNQRALIVENCITAHAGEVGYIYKPSIHSPINHTTSWTLTMHLTGPRIRAAVVDPPPFLVDSGIEKAWRATHAYKSVLHARARMRTAAHIYSVVASHQTAQVSTVLERCLRIASPQFRNRVAGVSAAHAETGAVPRVLKRAHEALELTWRTQMDEVILCARTEHGVVEELCVNSVACGAIDYVVNNLVVDSRCLPGGLSVDERTELCDTLIETGLYTELVL